MRSKTPFIALGIYILGGFITFVGIFVSNNANGNAQIRRELEVLVGSKNTGNELLDALPAIFEKVPSANALILSNSYGHLLGSMYEGKRVSTESYRLMLDEFKKSSFDYKTMPMPVFLQDYHLIKADNAEKSLSVFLLIRQNSSFPETFRVWRMRNPNFFWMVLVYLLGAAGIFLVSSHITDKLRNGQTDMAKPGNIKPAKSFAVHDNSSPEKIVKHFNKSILFENQLSTVLAQISERTMVRQITFLVKEESGWKAILQKRGNMYLKGDSVIHSEILEPEISARFQVTGFHEPITLSNDTGILFPVMVRDRLAGGFYLKEQQSISLSEHSIADIMEIIRSFAGNILVQQSYEKAVIDDDTGLYTNPYFYFSLKEKMVSGAKFSTLIFQLGNFPGVTPDSIRKFSRQMLLLLGQHPKPSTAARLDTGKFAVIFHEKDLPGQSQGDESWELAKKIRDLSAQYLHVDIYGALLYKPADINQVETYLRALQSSLEVSVRERKFAVYHPQKIEGIL